ncbi:MAG: class I SAM-dependent methyltransferase, partial [bacterium]
MGIPDFRGQGTESWILWDRKMAAALVQHYPKLSFEALVRMRFKAASEVPSAIFEYHLSHELNYSEKGSSRKFRIVRLLGGQRYEGLSKGKCLDLGCGSGSSLVAIAEDFQLGLGVDVLMQDLILGKKYAEEAGINKVHYICAFGENLPFEPETFDFVNATDTIEHIEDAQVAFLREVKRVLKPGGVFCFNSPNRFNLFTPEPHVKIWGLGFLPRAWMNPACRMIRGVEYHGKRLLSYFELKSILKKTFGRRFFITGLIIDPSQAKKRLIGKLFTFLPFTLKILN